MKLKHEELEKLLFSEDENGNALMLGKNGIELAFGSRIAPDDSLLNLLVASPLLYQALTRQRQMMLVMLEKFYQYQTLREMLLASIQSVEMAQNVALHGVSGVKVESEPIVKNTNRQNN